MSIFHNLSISLPLSNWVIENNDVEECGIAKKTTEYISHELQRDEKQTNIISIETSIDMI
jgi:hypothetical protein